MILPHQQEKNSKLNEDDYEYSQWFMVDGDLDDFIFFNDDQDQYSQR